MTIMYWYLAAATAVTGVAVAGLVAGLRLGRTTPAWPVPTGEPIEPVAVGELIPARNSDVPPRGEGIQAELLGPLVLTAGPATTQLLADLPSADQLQHLPPAPATLNPGPGEPAVDDPPPAPPSPTSEDTELPRYRYPWPGHAAPGRDWRHGVMPMVAAARVLLHRCVGGGGRHAAGHTPDRALAAAPAAGIRVRYLAPAAARLRLATVWRDRLAMPTGACSWRWQA